MGTTVHGLGQVDVWGVYNSGLTWGWVKGRHTFFIVFFLAIMAFPSYYNYTN